MEGLGDFKLQEYVKNLAISQRKGLKREDKWSNSSPIESCDQS